MTAFETAFLCLMIPLLYVFAYLAGKCDLLNTFCVMVQKWAKEAEEALKDAPYNPEPREDEDE